MSGYYRTKDGFFHTYFDLITDGEESRRRVTALILWAYASVVGNESLPYSDYFFDPYATVYISHRPGKLHAVGEGTPLSKDGLEEEQRNINGFVRRLPAGQKASEKARALAEDLGYDLDEGGDIRDAACQDELGKAAAK